MISHGAYFSAQYPEIAEPIPPFVRFDPSLGGTYTVNYHWDFTDDSTMTLSGTTLTGITDVVDGTTLQPTGSGPGSPTGIATYDTNGYTYLSGSFLSNTPNWIPTGMQNSQNWTVMVIARQTNWAGYTTNLPRSLWYCRSNGTGGYDNVNHAIAYNYTWTGSSCFGSGLYRSWFGRYQSSWTTRFRDYSTNVDATDPSVWFTGWNVGTNTMKFQRNDETICSFGGLSTVTAAGEGFGVGGAPIGFNKSNCVLANYYHVVIFGQVLDQAEHDAVYDAWVAYNA